MALDRQDLARHHYDNAVGVEPNPSYHKQVL